VNATIDAWLRFVRDAAGVVPGSPLLWAGLAVAARLAYVLYIGISLREQDRRRALTARWGERAHERFARRGTWLMNVDGVVLAVAIAKFAGEISFLRAPLFALGWALIAVGWVVTVLSARALGMQAWLWGDFFHRSPSPPEPRGIYRFVDDPKYVLGYLHAHGWALVCFSAVGLLLSAFAHAAILVYNHVVERPHFLALKDGTVGAEAAGDEPLADAGPAAAGAHDE
jgi:hypothetical protein